MAQRLRVGRLLVSTEVNGPGRRLVIWLQGCQLRCPGCFNPEFWDESGGMEMAIQDILVRIATSPEIEGLTFTGGEPFLQAQALLPLATAIKTKGLSLVCYSGYTLEEILSKQVPYGPELLETVDILIDGRYEEKERVPLLWRGSRNQQVHFLTARYRHLAALAARENQRAVELQIGSSGLTITGFFDPEIWQKLQEKINSLKSGGLKEY